MRAYDGGGAAWDFPDPLSERWGEKRRPRNIWGQLLSNSTNENSQVACYTSTPQYRQNYTCQFPINSFIAWKIQKKKDKTESCRKRVFSTGSETWRDVARARGLLFSGTSALCMDGKPRDQALGHRRGGFTWAFLLYHAERKTHLRPQPKPSEGCDRNKEQLIWVTPAGKPQPGPRQHRPWPGAWQHFSFLYCSYCFALFLTVGQGWPGVLLYSCYATAYGGQFHGL